MAVGGDPEIASSSPEITVAENDSEHHAGKTSQPSKPAHD
jgi:hypothetical protein